ncbi:MAG: zinc-ribbon domain-containing protein [Bacteroidales bacterium]
MIIYGKKGEKLAQESLATTCPNCGEQNCIQIYVFQKYAHVFWIPFFPMKKTGVTHCKQCSQILQLEDMPPTLTADYNVLRAKTRTPLWMFTGLAIVAALIIISAISNKYKDENNAKLILAPQSGDVYEIKTKYNKYTLLKIESVFNDTVYVRWNRYETDKTTGIDKLKSDVFNAYTQEIYGFSKAELKKMFDDRNILDIDRK